MEESKPRNIEKEYGIDKLEKEDLEKYQLFEEIKKEFNTKNGIKIPFKEGKIIKIGNDFIYELANHQRILFFKESRIFSFSNKRTGLENKQYFIHDETSFENALQKTDIKNGILKNEEKCHYDSNNSNISSCSIHDLDISEIIKTSYNYIEEPTLIKVKKIFSEDNYKKRFYVEKISDLDFNFKYLEKELIDKDLDFIDSQNSCHKKLAEFYPNNRKSLCFIFGPKGVGKTTNLLQYLNLRESPRLYFSLKLMSKSNSNIKKWKKIAFHETIYTFNTMEQMEQFAKRTETEILNSPYLMNFIFSYIKFVLDFYSNQKKKLFVVIDDYNQDMYDKNNLIDEIIKYATSNKHKLFLCIMGEGAYINKKFYRYLSNDNNDFLGVYWDFSRENEIIEHDFLKLPLYYYKFKDSINNNYNNIENEIKSSISREFKNIDLKSFFLLSKYINVSVELIELKDEFLFIPFKYLTVEKNVDVNENILLKFQFCLNIYKTVYKECIKGLLKADSLKTKMDLFQEERIEKDGIEFEDLIIEQIWNNTFNYLIFPENNKIKIKEIYHLKDNKDVNINLTPLKPIIIRQTIFKGKFYDLLLILEQNGKTYAIFIQIGLDKTGNEINAYIKNIRDHHEEYIRGIGTLINHEIDSLGFLLIFDYSHQKKLQDKNNLSNGAGFCLINDIDFLIYHNFKLFKNIDDSNPINSIEVTNKTLIFSNEQEKDKSIINKIKIGFVSLCKNISIQEKQSPTIFLTEKEKKMVINFIKNEYSKEYSELDFMFNIVPDKFSNFGMIDYDNFGQINVYKIKKTKYISYNNQICKISNSKIVKVDNKDIKFDNWDLYFLNKKRKNES